MRWRSKISGNPATSFLACPIGRCDLPAASRSRAPPRLCSRLSHTPPAVAVNAREALARIEGRLCVRPGDWLVSGSLDKCSPLRAAGQTQCSRPRGIEDETGHLTGGAAAEDTFARTVEFIIFSALVTRFNVLGIGRPLTHPRIDSVPPSTKADRCRYSKNCRIYQNRISH